MDVAIVLEDQPEDYSQLDRIIHTLNSKLVVLHFKTVIAFAEWFSSLSREPAPGHEKVTYRVMLMVSNFKLLGATHVSLFNKINSFMLKMGFLEEGRSRIPLLISARDVDGFDTQPFQNPIFDDIIYKPFDASMCRGKIQWALFGVGAMKKEELLKQKPVVPIEMLKNIEVDNITDVGFRSVIEEKIEPGKLAKYYFPSLKSLGADYGVYANCVRVLASKPPDKIFANEFTFFGLDRERAIQIRSIVAPAVSSPSPQPLTKATPQLKSVAAPPPIKGPINGVALVGLSKEQEKRCEGFLDTAFRNTQVVVYPNFTDFYTEVDAEKAAKAWLDQVGKVTPVIVEFDLGTDLFARVFKKDDRSCRPLNDYLGLTLEQLKRFKTLCLMCCKLEQRKAITQMWAQDMVGNQVVVLRDNGATYFITLVASKTFEGKIGDTKKRQIEVRPSEPREVQQYVKGDSKIPPNLKLILTSQTIANLREKEFWLELRGKMSGRPGVFVPMMVMGEDKIREYSLVQKLDCFTNYLPEPNDQMFFKRLIKKVIPEMQLATEEVENRLPVKESIKVGVPVQVANFSEISIAIEHHHALPTDCYREFVIHLKKENEYLRLLGKHMGSQPAEKRPGVFINYFTFFALGDKTTQKIRQWLNEQYSLSKQEKQDGSTKPT